MIKIHCITVVWGEVFVRTFLDLSLPTQLGSGNLAALGERGVYRIFTTLDDQKTMEQSPLFQELRKNITVEFIEIPLPGKNEDGVAKMNHYHCRAIQEAAQESAALIFLSPDIILSTGVFARVLKALSDGRRALAVLSLRLSKEKFSEAYLQWKVQKRELSPRELVKLAIPCLHFLSHTLFWGEKKINSWPSHLYWKLDENNLLARGFHLHPLFVWPENPTVLPQGSIDSSYLDLACPSRDRWEIIDDSDEMAIFEVSASSLRWQIAYFPASERFVGIWVANTTEEFQRQWAQKKIYIHSSDLQTSWQPTIEQSDRIIQQVISRAKNPRFFLTFFWFCYRARNKITRLLRNL